jgi:hypothetical protein
MGSGVLFVISALRAIVEAAGLFLLAQGFLYLLAGQGRDRNVVFQLFRLLTAPVIRLVRFITPPVIVDRHVPVVAFFLLFWLWIALAYVRRLL